MDEKASTEYMGEYREAASGDPRSAASGRVDCSLFDDVEEYCAVMKNLGVASLKIVHDYERSWRSGMPEEIIADVYERTAGVVECCIEHLQLMAARMTAYATLSKLSRKR